MRDHIYFETRTSAVEDYQVVDIFINYFNLTDELAKIEAPYAEAEGVPRLAGAYEGIPPLIAGLPSRHLLGEPHAAYPHPQGKSVLLVCNESGLAENWAFLAQIQVESDLVIWKNFEQWQRPLHAENAWKYETMQALVFDKTQYCQALVQLAQRAY